jgi:2'-5' RNA ligase
VRLFVAAEPSSRVRRKVADIGSTVRERLGRDAGRGIRWIPTENLHLTLWFLGEVHDDKSAAVLDALRPAMTEAPFQLQLAGLGTFPRSGSPSVLWLGVVEGQEVLARLHEELGGRVTPLGFAPESRSYSAHLTLARIKEPLAGSARSALRAVMESVDSDAGRCLVEELTVFRSRTAPSGAVYEPLLRVPLS